MRKIRLTLSILGILCLFVNTQVSAQSVDSVYNKIITLPKNLFKSVDEKATRFEYKLNRQTEKYLQRLSQQEKKLKRQLFKKDSSTAKKLFENNEEFYKQLSDGINNPAPVVSKLRNVYDGHLDSLQTTLKFLEKNSFQDLSPETREQFSNTLSQLNLLQGKMNEADKIKKMLQERQQFLKQQVQKLGVTKAYKRFQKQVYYYQQQVQEYKNIFDQPSQIERKALQLANNLPAFRDFFERNSLLSSLFKLPGNNPSIVADMGTLQTRGSIEVIAREQLGNNFNVNAVTRDIHPTGNGELDNLKNKLESLKSGQLGSKEISQPDFKPNDQKTKSFKKRLEIGTNLQSVKGNYYFPATTDIAITLGYKLNDKSVIGLGLSGKIGLGSGWNHIALSYEGIGLRQFLDVKLKGSFWISGGAEMNYRTKFSKIDELRIYNSWQQSALLGLTKKIKAGKAKSQIQFLYDFLWKQQRPVTQPFLFRIGYNF